MGGSPTDSKQVSSYYDTHKDIAKATSAREVFSASYMNALLDPAKLKNGYRDSSDSVDSPNSQAIAIGFDETGSMGDIPYDFVKHGFPRFINMIQGGALGYDPHILFAAIGDVKNDDCPLQVTQFEADTRMLDQLRLIYLEGCGGGNDGESYQIPWYFLAKHTKIACFNKRAKKGIYISIGDDKPHRDTSSREIKKIFGQHESIESSNIPTTSMRDMALEQWHLFHILLPRASGRYASDYVEEAWRKYLGKHIVILEDHRYVAETMATMLKIQGGMDRNEAIDMIENENAKKVVRKALKGFEIYEDDATPDVSAGNGGKEGIDFI